MIQTVQRNNPIPRVPASHFAAILVLVAGLLLGASPLLAEGPARSCDLAGTWYGGSDPHWPYQLSISPSAGGGYTTVALQTQDWLALGYTDATAWTGSIKKSGRNYMTYVMSMYHLTAEMAASVGADPTLPEVDVAIGRVDFAACNTLTITWTVYYIYFNFNTPAGDKIPFVTPPDIDYLGGSKIFETYHRLPSACPLCKTTPSIGESSFPNAFEPRTSRVTPKK